MLGARGSILEVVADPSFLTQPVSCEVSNAVGSANRSTALNVQCEQGRGRGRGQRRRGGAELWAGQEPGLGLSQGLGGGRRSAARRDCPRREKGVKRGV